MGPLNTQAEAALTGSGETEPPLEVLKTLVLGVPQQACVIKLHQGDIHDGRVMCSIEPSDFVEKGRAGRTWDEVALKLHLVPFPGNNLLLFVI